MDERVVIVGLRQGMSRIECAFTDRFSPDERCATLTECYVRWGLFLYDRAESVTLGETITFAHQFVAADA